MVLLQQPVPGSALQWCHHLIYKGFLSLVYSLTTTVQDLERSMIICTKHELQCHFFLEITIISWHFSLEQEENICVRALTVFHILAAHTLPRAAAAGLLAAALYLLCPGVCPHHWPGRGRGRACTGPPRRGRGRAARPPPHITSTQTLSPMQCSLVSNTL